MRILLVPVGSGGDVYPYVGVGLALRARGHDVSVVASPYFHDLVHRVGLRFVPWGTVDQYEAITRHPDLWDAQRGLEVIAEAIRLGSAELYDILKREGQRHSPLLIGSGLAFAARVAHDTVGLGLVTMHLQPSCFLSVFDTPVLHPWLGSINRWPLPIKRAVVALLDLAADSMLGPAVNQLRTQLGLGKARHITRRWWHSPQRVIGLFPDWFARPQPDWPPNVALTSFPLFDGATSHELAPDVERFIDDGPPPIVYAPGTANRQAAAFFQAATEASQLLDRRAVLLSRYREQLPTTLPAGVRHFDYVPLSQLLPRAAALVHHGGIGTAAQGLQTGCPQVVMPMTFDQPDNARRLVELGVARDISPRAFRGPKVAQELDRLLSSKTVTEKCHELARRLDGDEHLTQTCQVIEAA